jgi:hypothetical protein
MLGVGLVDNFSWAWRKICKSSQPIADKVHWLTRTQLTKRKVKRKLGLLFRPRSIHQQPNHSKRLGKLFDSRDYLTMILSLQNGEKKSSDLNIFKDVLTFSKD